MAELQLEIKNYDKIDEKFDQLISTMEELSEQINELKGKTVYDVDEVAEILKTNSKTVKKLIETKQLRAFDVGSGAKLYYRIPASALTDFLENISGKVFPCT